MQPVEHSGTAAALITVVGGLITVVGPLVYVGLSIGCTRVYAPLGVTPSEVGLDYGVLLARTGTYVTALGVFLVPFVLLVAFAASLTEQAIRAWGTRARVVVGVLGALVLLVSMLGVRSTVGIASWGFWIVVFGAAAAIAKCVAPVWGTPRQIAAIWSLLLVGFVALAVWLGAEADADSLKAGSKPQDEAFGVPVPWAARVVHVSWAQKPAPAALPESRCFLYLGQSEGTAVFYDADRERSLRLPASSVLMEVKPDRARCSDRQTPTEAR